MAVSKLWPVTVRLATVLDYASNPEKTTKSKSKYSDADYQALRDVVAYAKDGEKTERELFCEGIHCNPQTAREQFITVKEQFDKPDGIQAYHGYGLYLYYCYRLGYLPKYKAGQQNHARVHYLFKEDLMKIDELTKQVTLLGKHHIGTDEQLFSYQHSVEEQVKTLTADRTHLRNEIRKVNITDAELSQAKASISLLTEKLKELRKEVKLCQDIAVRSKVIEEKVDAVRAEEEKSKRKENRNYEQRR